MQKPARSKGDTSNAAFLVDGWQRLPLTKVVAHISSEGRNKMDRMVRMKKIILPILFML